MLRWSPTGGHSKQHHDKQPPVASAKINYNNQCIDASTLFDKPLICEEDVTMSNSKCALFLIKCLSKPHPRILATHSIRKASGTHPKRAGQPPSVRNPNTNRSRSPGGHRPLEPATRTADGSALIRSRNSPSGRPSNNQQPRSNGRSGRSGRGSVSEERRFQWIFGERGRNRDMFRYMLLKNIYHY